jgi:hypothetical protein
VGPTSHRLLVATENKSQCESFGSVNRNPRELTTGNKD